MSAQQQRQFAAKCPICQARVRVQETDLGTRRTCPKCKNVFVVPARASCGSSGGAVRDDDWQPPIEIPIVCHVCQTRYYGRPEQAGTNLACPDCNVANRVPSLPAQRKAGARQAGPQDDFLLHEGVDQPRESADTQFRVICKVCDSVIYCRRQHVGKRIRCPDCGSVLTVPEPPPPKPKSSVVAVDPGIGIRPAAQMDVFKKNADSLLAKAAAKYHEEERKKPVPPKRPFVDGVWTFPFHLEVLPVLIVIALLGCLVPYFVQLALQMRGQEMVIGMMLFIPVALLSLATLFVATNSFMTIVATTAMGFSKIEWQKFEILEGLKNAILFIASLGVSFGPGTSLALMLGSSNAACLALPVGFLVFPFVFLSMLDAGSAAVPFTPYLWSTLSRNRRTWVKFYLASLPVFLLMTVPHVIVLVLQNTPILGEMLPLLTLFFVAITLTTTASLVYFRLIGRLAWVIDNEILAETGREETAFDDDVAQAARL